MVQEVGGGRSPAPAVPQGSPATERCYCPASPLTRPTCRCAECTAPVAPWLRGEAAAAAYRTPAAWTSSAAGPTPASWRSATVRRPTGTLDSSQLSSSTGLSPGRTEGGITSGEDHHVWRRRCRQTGPKS